jgi:hypothetical protein
VINTDQNPAYGEALRQLKRDDPNVGTSSTVRRNTSTTASRLTTARSAPDGRPRGELAHPQQSNATVPLQNSSVQGVPSRWYNGQKVTMVIGGLGLLRNDVTFTP